MSFFGILEWDFGCKAMSDGSFFTSGSSGFGFWISNACGVFLFANCGSCEVVSIC
uniref:Uncharacterized protein n=1 Tax=Nelumbo nucifera TaxID=4432 RepID=A0A822YIT3_NELNU|nr:TPA_asm: hypothetical protein HUJ06_010050 [Nelumbo nucifera]